MSDTEKPKDSREMARRKYVTPFVVSKSVMAPLLIEPSGGDKGEGDPFAPPGRPRRMG